MSVASDMSGGSDETVPAEQWQARALQAQRGGDFLATYDAAMRGVAAHPDSISLRHRAVLALASTGATAKARAMLRDMGVPGGQEDEITALEARLAKEHALSVQGEERTRHALTAATLYECINARTGGTYSGINAAAMRLFSGDPERAAMLAKQVLETCAKERSASPEEAYYVGATEAEAALLLGDTDRATVKLRMVKLLSGDDHAARATLRRHLRRICDEKRLGIEVLDILKPPAVMHYTGCRMAPVGFAGKIAPYSERSVIEQIGAYITARQVGFAYGSLACGADILFAEALLARSAELHVVLPAPEAEFCRVAVAPGGATWLKRFKSCLDAATSVTFAGSEADPCTDELIAYGARIAMGLSLLRAGSLDADVEQAAVWDGEPGPPGSACPAAEVAAWKRRGLRTFFVDPGPGTTGTELPPVTYPESAERTMCAMLFGEIAGYGRLRELDVPLFIREVMGALGRVLDGYGDEVLMRTTWGDSLHVVLRSPDIAARCALDLQASMAAIRPGELGLPPELALRLGAHVGLVYRGYDPLMKGPALYGMQAMRTVRIEPLMPDGEVFITEPFAAALTLESKAFACEYVGQMQTSRGSGPMRMYVLKPG